MKGIAAIWGALALVLTGCGGVETVVPETGAAAIGAMERAFREFDPEKHRERRVGHGLKASIEALDRVNARVWPAAKKVCGRLYGGDCSEVFGKIRVVVHHEDARLNAYAREDFQVGFFGGLVRLTGNDDELAAILAHEYAHLVYDHNEKVGGNWAVGKLIGMAAVLGAAAAGYYDPHVAEAAMETAGSIGAVVRTPAMELEADHFAVYALAEAGYDPVKGGMIFVRMARHEGETRSRFLSTHPSDRERVAAWFEGVEAVSAGRQRPVVVDEPQRKAQRDWEAHRMRTWEERWMSTKRTAAGQSGRRTRSATSSWSNIFAKCPDKKIVQSSSFEGAINKIWFEGQECACPRRVFEDPSSECQR